jgi:bifunctional UDP-N-acetylglucosamine pyrophosphorylase/glucosamine-1-phosphate N-acetyltransferase
VATVVLDDASGYGRVVRDDAGQIERVVETKVPGDATDEELAIREVNTSIYAFDGGSLLEALSQVRSENAQGEYYLTDVIPLLRGGGAGVAAFTTDDPALLLGVNDRAGLAAAGAEAQRRIHERHMLAGVTIVEPASTSIDIDVEIGADTVIEPCSQLRGKTRVGSGATVGPHSTLIDALIGDGSRVIHSHLERCELRSGVSVGPFAYLRPETLLREGAKAGTFVEIKNSDIGERAKVPHLSYIGDADVGQDTNLGASSITANYDGRAKHRTTIGSRVHGAVHTSYVAPVTVGDDAYTGAGSVVTHDVPPGALAIARARQQNIEDYAGRRPEVPEAEQGPVKEEASDPGAEGKSDP